MNEVKWNTSNHIERGAPLGYRPLVQPERPGIARASSIPTAPSDEAPPADIVRLVLDDLDALIGQRGPHAAVAFGWGTADRGGARLIRRPGTEEAESLRISWNHYKIERIEIESRDDVSFCGPESPANATELIDWLVPKVWAHIRCGGTLPAGIERFAGFF